MRACPRYELRLFLHAHGQLKGVPRVLVDNHLSSCDACRARWARWTVERDSLRRTFSPMPMVDEPAQQFMDAVGARIRAAPRPSAIHHSVPARRITGGRLMALAFAIALLALSLAAAAAYVPSMFWWPPGNDCGNTPANAPTVNAPLGSGPPMTAPASIGGGPSKPGELEAARTPAPARTAPPLTAGPGTTAVCGGCHKVLPATHPPLR